MGIMHSRTNKFIVLKLVNQNLPVFGSPAGSLYNHVASVIVVVRRPLAGHVL
jgi:hypothetical protein